MIGMLTGTCLVIGTGEAILDVGGVGYLLSCGSRTLSGMEVGKTVCVHVETHVREQAITLFGFISEEERAWFVRLQSVQGVGAKVALAILDILSPGDILSATSLEDKTAFSRASGVGPKLATRIATELSGKPPPAGRGFSPVFVSATSDAPSGATADAQQGQMGLRNDAVSGLVNLGIGQSDALRAVAGAYNGFDGTPTLDELIKAAFKELSA